MKQVDAVELKKEYDMRFEALQDYRNAVWKVLTRDFFQNDIPKNSTVLDLGCGWGEFINNIQAGRKYAMDLNPRSREKLKKDVIFIEQDCSQSWSVEESSLDVIFTSNFFEHIPTKEMLSSILKQSYKSLKPGGKLICLGPNIKYLPGAYWEFWDHYLPLTENSMEEGMRLSGFKVVRKVDRFLPYTMVNKRKVPVAFIQWYLNMPWFWRFFGKQFLVVGEK